MMPGAFTVNYAAEQAPSVLNPQKIKAILVVGSSPSMLKMLEGPMKRIPSRLSDMAILFIISKLM